MSHHHLVLQVAIIVKQVGQVEEVHRGGSHIDCSSSAKDFVAVKHVCSKSNKFALGATAGN